MLLKVKFLGHEFGYNSIKTIHSIIAAIHKIPSSTGKTELTIPNTKHPFFITVDASLIGISAVLFQLNEENKMKVISYKSRILNPQEKKLSTLD